MAKLIFYYDKNSKFSIDAKPYIEKVANEFNMNIEFYEINDSSKVIPEKYDKKKFPILFIEDENKIEEVPGFSGHDYQELIYKINIDRFLNPEKFKTNPNLDN
jgi:hypothetical protein